MTALEQTNIMLAKLLDAAFEKGVSHWTLEFSDLGLPAEFETFFFPCIQWLEAEGLIRLGGNHRTLGGIASGSVTNLSLTARGMALLGFKIEINGKPELVSSAVKKISDEGKVDGSMIGDIIGGILGGFTKSIGS